MRQSVKISEVKVGDYLIADRGFTCLLGNNKVQVKESNAGLYVECSEGEHYLEGQKRDDTYTGFKKA